MSVVYKDVNLFGQNYTFCMSSPGGQDGYSKDFDIMLGDDFLRNVYSIYDFGDNQSNGTSGEPYMQLLAKTNFDKAKDQFVSIRNRLLSQTQELSPNKTLDLLTRQIQLQGGHVVSANSSMRNVTKTYARVVVGLLSVNLFIGVVLVLLGVGNYVHASPRPDKYPS
ncbi:hypothetical protein BDQ17DRAFT_1354592 [Cyathus striatus]|nr:hypothetical protein BDQ17DRAFT_1354592 [Cyathus striatus]